MQGRTPKKVVVSRAALKRAGERSTKASAKLAGRELPPGYKRSEAVAAFLAERQAKQLGNRETRNPSA